MKTLTESQNKISKQLNLVIFKIDNHSFGLDADCVESIIKENSSKNHENSANNEYKFLDFAKLLKINLKNNLIQNGKVLCIKGYEKKIKIQVESNIDIIPVQIKNLVPVPRLIKNILKHKIFAGIGIANNKHILLIDNYQLEKHC